jgi:hypothetical protein
MERAIGFRPSNRPNEDYQQSAHVVWWVMREAAVTDDSQPVYDEDSGRKGYEVTGVSPTVAIKQVWESLALPENKKALNAAYAGVTKAIEAAGVAHSVSRGRGAVPATWWVADTWEAPQDGTQAQEPVTEETPAPAELPTDWGKGKVTPEHSGKEVPTLPLIEQEVSGDSHGDRFAKAVDIMSSVLTELEEENARLWKENRALTGKLEDITRITTTLSD